MKKLLFLFAISSVLNAAEVQNRVAKIYPLGSSTSGVPAFVQKIRISVDGLHRRADSTIEDANHQVVMTESALYEKGRLVEQKVAQLQIGERYELSVKDSTLSFRTYKTVDGTEKLIKEKSEKEPAEFITGPGFELFLNAQAEKIASGEKVRAQFGVFELARLVEFQFRAPSRAPAGQNIKVRMTPASFWLSLLVSPIEMELDPSTHQLVHYRGRTPLRVKSGDDWQALDAEIFYSTVIESKLAQPDV